MAVKMFHKEHSVHKTKDGWIVKVNGETQEFFERFADALNVCLKDTFK